MKRAKSLLEEVATEHNVCGCQEEEGQVAKKTKLDIQLHAGATTKRGEEEEEALFDMLPNELLDNILVQHLDPLWHLVCKSVCQRWRFLLLKQGGTPFFTASYFAAKLAREGHLKVIQWARSQGCPWNSLTCDYAAEGGHMEVLQWVRSQGCPWDAKTCANAAAGGHLEVLQWARSQGCPWDVQTCASAASGGHLEVLQWARSQGCPWDKHVIMLLKEAIWKYYNG